MYVVVANKGLWLHRENRIAEIVGDITTKEFVTKRSGSNKYYTSSNTIWALVFKTESGAKRLIQDFNSDTQKERFSNKFNWIKDHVLSVQKLTKEEYEKICDHEIEMLKKRYDRQLAKLSNKKSQYK